MAIFALAGCKSVSQSHHNACQVGLNFSIDNTIDSKHIVDFDKLHGKVSKAYSKPSQSNHLLELELVKAYVRPNAYILVATAVVARKDNNGERVNYYRASNVDANLANLDSEYQSALNNVVLLAIQKAVIDQQNTCNNLASPAVSS